ncbi:putative lipoprotein [Leptolyngbya sp. NIES-3755]|nr:putative lipoprotein [Leptolyngbya sp. NIES-3755]
MNFDQAEFEVRCEWGEQGVLRLAPISDVIIIIDVLSFSTCVEIATRRGAIVFPYRWKDKSARAFARSMNAEVAGRRSDRGYSLSPTSLLAIDRGTRLVLPSPNGSSLNFSTGATPTLTGCLRNHKAVAVAAMQYGQRIGVIPAGEKWHDGSLRPSFEDWIGAGAVISCLNGSRSPEAQLAIAAYEGIFSAINSLMKQCISGQELIQRGFEQDVDLAAEINVSDCVPMLIDGAYINCKS